MAQRFLLQILLLAQHVSGTNNFRLQLSVIMADKELDQSESVEINNTCV